MKYNTEKKKKKLPSKNCTMISTNNIFTRIMTAACLISSFSTTCILYAAASAAAATGTDMTNSAVEINSLSLKISAPRRRLPGPKGATTPTNDVDCVGQWGPYSECSADGKMTSIYEVTRVASNGGAACSNNNGDVYEENCTPPTTPGASPATPGASTMTTTTTTTTVAASGSVGSVRVVMGKNVMTGVGIFYMVVGVGMFLWGSNLV